MLKYRIIVSNTRDTTPLVPSKRPGEEGYKDFVLIREVGRCNFSVNDRVKVRKGHKRGHIAKIHNKADDVNWQKGKPFFIEVNFDDGTNFMCHHSQLKRSK